MRVLFIVFLFLVATPANASETEKKISAYRSEQVTTLLDIIYVEVFMNLPDSYSLLNDDVSHITNVNISTNLTEPLFISTYISSYLFMKPLNVVARAYYQNGTREIQPIMTSLGTQNVLSFTFEAGLKGFEIIIQGRLDGLSLIWRNMVDFGGVLVQYSEPIPIFYNTVIEAPKNVEVTSITSPYIENLYIKESTSEASKTYVITIPTSLLIYYRPSYWLVLALALTLLLTFIIAFTTYYRKRITPMIFVRIGTFIINTQNIIRSRLSSDRILTSFILCSLLMVSLGLYVGPDPRIKIYAIATPNMAPFLETTLESNLGPVQVIGPQDIVSEFETMANLGIIGVFVVTDYPSIALDRVSKYLLEPLQQVPLIILDEASADPAFSRAVKEIYIDKVILIENINEISSPKVISKMQSIRRSNPFGIHTQIEFFKAVSTIIALLSFIEAFLALAFLSSRLIESGRTKGMGAFVEAIALPAFVFYFTQAVYMVSSVLLNMPIGLHAVTSGSMKITVVSFLGFGGGSSPRAVAGLLGILAGALATIKSNSEVDRFGFLAFLILMLLLAIEPFTGGTFFYDVLLWFLSGPRMELTRTTIVYTKDILSNIGRIFGSWSSPMFGVSTGEVLFYAGIVPIFLFPNLKRTSATILLLVSSFAAGSGFMRTAEMTPYKTVASLFPGLMMGMLFVFTFILVSSVEAKLRLKINRI